MNARNLMLLMMFGLVVLLAIGCGKKPEPATDLDVASQTVDTEATTPGSDAESDAEMSRFDDLFRKRAEEEEAAAAAARKPPEPVLVMEDIHFEFDKYSLTPAARQMLTEIGKAMKDTPAMRIQVEGHCDERGTQEYNLALGQRRAQAAKDYLVSFGIDPGRITIISYGEERPLDPGQNEEAWAANRRAHFNQR